MQGAMALYPLFRPLVFAMDAERAHRATIRALKLLPPGIPAKRDPLLAVSVARLEFPNPVGLAAGFDKDAEVHAQMLGFGFGFVEVGTLTPRPQEGNPKPRLFRLAQDRAVINRLGFNNRGQEAALPRLGKRRRGVVGVNVGANKDSSDRIADYVEGVRRMAPVADYLTVNISSPNTPGLRALQDKVALDDLLCAAMEARGDGPPPLFLKVAPDLERQEINDVVEVAAARKVDAIIIGNTTLSRPQLRSRYRDEEGGLSGAPLKLLAQERLRDFARSSGGSIPLIAAGGIENGVDAYLRIRSGASLVQLYSALVYQGPELASAVARELKGLLRREGFTNVAEAIGTDL